MFSFEHDAQTLLVRLVALEAGQIDEYDGPSVNRIREAFEATDGRGASLVDRLEDTIGGVQALETVHGYADRLMLHRSLGSSTTLETIRTVVEQVREETGQPPLVVVDYLQKVKVPNGSPEEEERTTDIVEGLKDMALDFDIPVLAVVAADKEGLESGRRMRVSHLRGSSALAYEADTVLLVNDKYDVVARQHLVYNVAHADRFHDWVVMSVEKNRAGKDGVTLELHKRFDQSRFEGDGRRVMEHLVDERVFTE